MITQGGLLVCFSVVLQLLPSILGEIFIIATILSALPIFILARINPKVGFIGFIVSTLLILIFNVHEGIFFLATNGLIGYSLGACSYYIKNKWLISLLSGVILLLGLSIINYIIGIPVFGIDIPGNFTIEIFSMFLFSYFYCYIYLLFAKNLFNQLNKRYPLM